MYLARVVRFTRCDYSKNCSQRGDVEIHLVVSRSAEKTLFLETGKRLADLKVNGGTLLFA